MHHYASPSPRMCYSASRKSRRRTLRPRLRSLRQAARLAPCRPLDGVIVSRSLACVMPHERETPRSDLYRLYSKTGHVASSQTQPDRATQTGHTHTWLVSYMTGRRALRVPLSIITHTRVSNMYGVEIWARLPLGLTDVLRTPCTSLGQLNVIFALDFCASPVTLVDDLALSNPNRASAASFSSLRFFPLVSTSLRNCQPWTAETQGIAMLWPWRVSSVDFHVEPRAI